MATFAQGSRSALAIGVETTFGTAATSLTYLPIKTHSLDLSKELLEGQDIQPDRMQRISRHGNRNAGGSIEVDLSKDNYDSLLESGMLSEFDVVTGVMEVGTTPKFLTIEDRFEDISQFRKFTGMSVNTMSFSIAPNQMVNTTFDLVGKDGTISGAGSTVSAAVGNEKFDSFSGEIYEGGVGSGDLINLITSIEFSVSNSFAPTFVVGSPTTPALEYGRSIVTGTMSVYMEDAVLINKFINETESAIQVSVDDPSGSNAYTFFMPRVKYNGASVPLANEQSRIIQLPFTALYDAAEGTQLRLTKTV